MTTAGKFSDLLNEILIRRDRNAAWLAEKMEIDRATTNRWTNGVSLPRSVETVRRMLDVLLYVLGVLFNQLTPRRFFVTLVVLLHWSIAAWLMTPFLQWPLGTATERLWICVYFAAATLLVPLSIGMAVTPLSYTLARPPQPQDRWKSTFLKITGAYVGHNTFAGTLFFIGLGWYYVSGHALPTTLGWLFMGIPLLFGYVTARRIPLERVRMFEGDLKPHEADLTFLIAMVCFGPFLAGFVYLWHSYLAWRPLGVLLVLALLVILWWQQRAKR